MNKKPIIKREHNKHTYDVEFSQIDRENIDVYQGEDMAYPIMERLNNGITWPEAPKGGIDLKDTYEVSSIPEDPGTPLESVELLEEKGVMPSTRKHQTKLL